ncbi:MAG: hypothetical protein SGPRY_009427 [Prymnesium sp.]
MRASSADFAALCYDEMFGKAWTDATGAGRGPRLDLALIEYNWSSSPGQIAALIQALHTRSIPVLGIIYVHPINMNRIKTIRRDPTPDKGADRAGKYDDFARVFSRHEVPFMNTSGINHRLGWRSVIGPIMSAAHITPEAHSALADEVVALLQSQCERLHVQLQHHSESSQVAAPVLDSSSFKQRASRTTGECTRTDASPRPTRSHE